MQRVWLGVSQSRCEIWPRKWKILPRLIHPVPLRVSAVTKIVYYQRYKCMIINMYKAMTVLNKLCFCFIGGQH